jgi:hypothetical protein
MNLGARMKYALGTAGFSLGLLFLPLISQAAPNWSAQEMIRSHTGTIAMTPGESLEFIIGFKNTGTASWRNYGSRFVSVYTVEPTYRNSEFADTTWISVEQPAKLVDDEVGPGGIGRVKFTLYAPLEPGEYREAFRLAAEDTTWICEPFHLNISVSEANSDPTAGFKAAKMLVSADELSLKAGETASFRVAFKNVGRKTWSKSGSIPAQLVAETGNAYSFRDNSWNGYVAASLRDNLIKPGQLSFFDLTLKAPNYGGNYTARFKLAAGTHPMDGGIIDIPIRVSGYAGTPPTNYTQPSSSNYSRVYEPELSYDGPKGPDIRIGLFTTTDPVILHAAGDYTLINGDHQTVRTLSGTTRVVFDFATRTYTVTNGSYTFVDSKHVHFRPVNPDTTIFEIVSYQNRPSWDPTVNFNKFRGQIDVHYIAATDKLWVVEQLPVEDYMLGFAETSNGSPFEYQKALVTAARTYALFVKLIGGKHKAEYFDLDTTGNDQVYKGYTSEQIRPNVAAAARATRGQVVTYGGEIVVTPYFSQSDGRTRAWTEVWSSRAHPWLVSVPAPYDQGLSMWGHGVGMSANDAYGRAKHDGWNHEQILKYYYTNSAIQEMY